MKMEIIKYAFYIVAIGLIVTEFVSFEMIVGFAVLYIADTLYFFRKEIQKGNIKIGSQ